MDKNVLLETTDLDPNVGVLFARLCRPFESETPTIHTEPIIHYYRVTYVIDSPVCIVGVLFKRYSIHGLQCDVLRFRPFCMPDKAFEEIVEVLTAVLMTIKVFSELLAVSTGKYGFSAV